MTDLPITAATPRLPAVLTRMHRDAPQFTTLGLLVTLSLAPTATAMLTDTRLFQGTDNWTKPVKFQIALILYLLTLAFYARWLPPGLTASRRFRIYTGIVCTAIIAELAWIILAAAFGTASHFNTATPALAILYAVMGLAAVTLTTASLTFGIAIWRNRSTGLPPALHLGLSLGLILTFVLTVIVAGTMSSGTGHFIGTPVTHAALPVMGWSREVGDLRVAHFFATHAMHAIPLAALVATLALPPRSATLATVAGAIAYTAFIAFLFWQALNGQPFLA
jgi:hypothetical protein